MKLWIAFDHGEPFSCKVRTSRFHGLGSLCCQAVRKNLRVDDDSCNFAVVFLRFTEIKKYFPQLTPMFVPCTKINTQSCYLEVQGMEDSLLGFSVKDWEVSGKKKK